MGTETPSAQPDIQRCISELESLEINMDWDSSKETKTNTPVSLSGPKSALKELMINALYAANVNDGELARARNIMGRNNGQIPIGSRGTLPTLREVDRLFDHPGEVNFTVTTESNNRKMPRFFSEEKPGGTTIITITGGGESDENYFAEDTFTLLLRGIDFYRTNGVRLEEAEHIF